MPGSAVLTPTNIWNCHGRETVFFPWTFAAWFALCICIKSSRDLMACYCKFAILMCLPLLHIVKYTCICQYVVCMRVCLQLMMWLPGPHALQQPSWGTWLVGFRLLLGLVFCCHFSKK